MRGKSDMCEGDCLLYHYSLQGLIKVNLTKLRLEEPLHRWFMKHTLSYRYPKTIKRDAAASAYLKISTSVLWGSTRLLSKVCYLNEWATDKIVGRFQRISLKNEETINLIWWFWTQAGVGRFPKRAPDAKISGQAITRTWLATGDSPAVDVQNRLIGQHWAFNAFFPLSAVASNYSNRSVKSNWIPNLRHSFVSFECE